MRIRLVYEGHRVKVKVAEAKSGHPFVGRHNEYQPEGGDALRLGSKAGTCVGGG